MTRQMGTDAPDAALVEPQQEKPKLLTAAEILAADDIKDEYVEVPEWGGTVRVLGMSGHQRDAFEESMVEMRGRNRHLNLTNFRANLVARTVVDEKGKRVFDNTQVEALGKKSAAALTRVLVVSQKLSGLSDEQVNELTAELKDAPSAGSGSD